MDIKEDFLAFVPVSDLSGSGLAEKLKTELVRLGLDLHSMRGQGYDGAAVMSGSFRGVQALIRGVYPLAVYTHCSSHSLNLCLNDASKVSDIRNAFAMIGEVCSIFQKLLEKEPTFSRSSSSLLRAHFHAFVRTARLGGLSGTKPWFCSVKRCLTLSSRSKSLWKVKQGEKCDCFRTSHSAVQLQLSRLPRSERKVFESYALFVPVPARQFRRHERRPRAYRLGAETA